MKYQEVLLQRVSGKLKDNESIGNALSEVLHISLDAAYRRYRGETAFTINELARICSHFGISMDEILDTSGKFVSFDYKPLSSYRETMDNYLINIHQHISLLKSQPSPELLITVNNTPFLPLLNFPHLVRFKLHFWAKNHLYISEYREKKFAHTKFSSHSYAIGREILLLYNSIPSVEIYDAELLRGFAREIYFNYLSGAFENPHYALFLCDQLKQFTQHLKHQAQIGKKFIVNTPPPTSGNTFEMYHNGTLNAISSFYYRTSRRKGLFVAHNYMNILHTSDTTYVSDTKEMMDFVLSNSILISQTNEIGRNMYFNSIDKQIDYYKIQISLKER